MSSQNTTAMRQQIEAAERATDPLAHMITWATEAFGASADDDKVFVATGEFAGRRENDEEVTGDVECVLEASTPDGTMVCLAVGQHGPSAGTFTFIASDPSRLVPTTCDHPARRTGPIPIGPRPGQRARTPHGSAVFEIFGACRSTPIGTLQNSQGP